MAYQFQNASILIADDMKPMRQITTSVLQTFGFKDIYQAEDGEEAFRLICRHNPDVVLTDWMMDPMNGLELTKKIRNHTDAPNPFVPIIIMTGYSARFRVLKARDAGMTEFLVKPFSAHDLYVRLTQLIEKPRQFVDNGEFFGPDRRRKYRSDYTGPMRREMDKAMLEKEKENARFAAEVFKKLRQEIKETTINS